MSVVLISGFSRNETEVLTGLSKHRLEYLDRSGVLKPQRVGSASKKWLFYSWQQVLELRAISKLRDSVSLKTIKEIIKFLEEHSDNPELASNKIIVIDGIPHWLKPTEVGELLIQATNNGNSVRGQIVPSELMVLPSIDEFKQEIVKSAKESNLIDFNSVLSRLGKVA